MVALPFFRSENIVAQAQKVADALPLESKCLPWFGTPGREQMHRVAFRLPIEKLPNGAHFHERGRFGLHFTHAVEEFQSLGVALCQPLLEIALEAQVLPEEHEWINVAPNLAQVGHQAYL